MTRADDRQLPLFPFLGGEAHPFEPGYARAYVGSVVPDRPIWRCTACGCYQQPDGSFPHADYVQGGQDNEPCRFARKK